MDTVIVTSLCIYIYSWTIVWRRLIDDDDDVMKANQIRPELCAGQLGRDLIRKQKWLNMAGSIDDTYKVQPLSLADIVYYT